MKTIIVIEYPETFAFKVKKSLPKFKYGCNKRTKILLSQLIKQKIPSPCHDYSSYVVEVVKLIEEMPNYEYWYLGS